MSDGRNARRCRIWERLGVAVLALAGGCYTYVPVRGGAVGRPGDEIQVALTDAGTTRLAALLGPRVTEITGHVTTVADSSVVVSVAELSRSGVPTTWTGDTVRVVPGDVREFSRRQLNRVTTVATAAVAAAAVVLGAHALGGSGGGTRTISGSTGK
ncbi:MAG TPA: hypothetical protein VGD56_07710 [Gemmatirosa sp.]